MAAGVGGTAISMISSVMAMAKTPSLNASRRPLFLNSLSEG